MATSRAVLAARRRDQEAQAAAESDRACRRWRGCRASSSRLVCDSPLPEPLDALELKGIPRRAAARVPRGAGLQSLLDRLNGSAQSMPPRRRRQPRATPQQREVRPEPKIDHSLYETVTTLDALDRWIAEARANGFVALDTETDGFDCVTAKLVGISLATEPQQGLLHPARTWRPRPALRAGRADCRGRGAGAAEAAARGPGDPQDRPQFQIRLDRASTAAASDVAPVDDSLVMSFDLDAGGLNSHGMDDLAKKHLDHDCIAYKDVCGIGPEADQVQPGAARPRHRICRRGCRRHPAAVDAVQGRGCRTSG